MRKAIPTFILTFLFIPFAFGQGLILLDADGNDITGDTLFVHGDAHANLIKADIFFHNDSDEDMQVMVRKIEIDILEGTNNAFCWDEFCFSPDVYESPDPIILGPGETSGADDFYVEYYPQGQSGITIIDYEFFSRNEGFDEVITTVVFETEDTTNLPFYEEEQPFVSSVYPNPASEYTTFSYQLPGVSGEVTLAIYTTTGLLVEHHRLNDTAGELLIDTGKLNNGLYLLVLKSAGHRVFAGKLLVQK